MPSEPKFRPWGLYLGFALLGLVLLWPTVAAVWDVRVRNTYGQRDDVFYRFDGVDVWPGWPPYIYHATNQAGYPCRIYVTEQFAPATADDYRAAGRREQEAEAQRHAEFIERAFHEWKEQGIR